MGIVALVVWPRLYEQNFIYSSNKDSLPNFISIGPVILGKKMFRIWNLSDHGPKSLNGPDLCYP